MEDNKNIGSPEARLLAMIREHDNPGCALMTATLVILGYLKLHGSSGEPSPDLIQVSS